ncbi:MAG: 50S ribosome-binding GTPase [Deferribacteraceae bacterium]|jgi:bifunctional enzyme CysN/CysC/sulfate adenylyltransferase subunit 1|nr:50S ribosome-binding GTPase [Deferribacteraceae bacterium]
MNIVITGHVDHGKSTLIGRLLADTGSLPEGKLAGIKNSCLKNGRVFEYSMLLDALEEEQKQGITIDIARIFFKSAKREYIILDAPGHIEFLRNMLSGASRATAAVLVIDAAEGVAENSKRHGLILSLLGISQLLVAVNKLDLVDYSQEVFEKIRREYGEYLQSLGVAPTYFIPVSAREGENIIEHSGKITWYDGATILEALDSFQDIAAEGDFFAMPIQDIYRFSDDNDERRIYAGTVVSGEVKVGSSLTFLPSQKKARINRFENWNEPEKERVRMGEAIGFTLYEDIYIPRGEVAVSSDANLPVKVAGKIKANLIWLGRYPLIFNKDYLLKIGSAKVQARLAGIEKVLGEEGNSSLNELRRNECGTVILSFARPAALTRFSDNASLGRFVIVDEYNAAGGGIIVDAKEEGERAPAADFAQFEEELFTLLKKYFPHRF